MKIIYQNRVRKASYLDDIKKLITEADRDFIPPLSARTSITQNHFTTEYGEDNGIDNYFEAVKKQSAFLAIIDGHVIGFISIIKRFSYPRIEFERKYLDNIYISTIIVDKKYRGRGYAIMLYRALLSKFKSKYILTRTWSTNNIHIKILKSYKFDKFDVKPNDRGEGIDTIYFCREPVKRSVLSIIKQYHMTGNFVFMIFLIAFTLLSVYIWYKSEYELVNELGIAVATSLMASFLCLLSDTIIKYRDSKNDEYISSLKGFGIENLQFQKDILLEDLIEKSKKELWISGYRLIMTSRGDFLNAIEGACKNNKHYSIKLLLVPYWTETYKAIYGDESVEENYIKVFNLLKKCRDEYGTDVDVRFTKKTLFSDTYKVDNRIITGPYLHCKDKGLSDRKLTAKDFFSLDITDENKELHRLMKEDFLNIWNSETISLDWENYNKKSNDIKSITYLPV